MTNEDLKLEAIKKAYGVWYISQKINDLGWFIMEKPYLDKPIDNGFNEFDVDIVAFAWRPKSLRGLETNNQWIRIEEDGSNLPETRGKEDVWLLCNDGEIHIANTVLLNDWEIRHYWLRTVSHYQLIIKPEPPIW